MPTLAALVGRPARRPRLLWLLTAVCLGLGAAGPSRAQAPGWSVTPTAFQSTMTLTAALILNSVPATATDNVVAAFAGNEVRGVAVPVARSGQLLFFMTVYANTGGEVITFKAYLPATGETVEIDATLVFTVNANHGTLTEPFAWHAGVTTGCPSGPPGWQLHPTDFETSMNVTGQVYVEGTPLLGPGDLLAAFAGEEVRGLAAATETGSTSAFFLTIYANTGEETISFKYYDAIANLVRPIGETLAFQANAIHGSPAAPLPLTAGCVVLGTSTIPDEHTSLPTHVALGANYPNPFNPRTTIPYDLAEAGPVRLTIHDTLGRRVASLIEATQPPGRYTAGFDASNLPSGLYLYRLQAGPTSLVRPMLLLK